MPVSDVASVWGPTRFLAAFVLTLLAGCASSPEAPSAPRVTSPLLTPTMLEGHGLALLTPVSGPEHEQDRQALALVFADRFARMRPEVRVVPLSQTVGAVNRAGLTRAYQRMYETFGDTGVMERDTLAKLRGVCGARYFALLRLAEFRRSAEMPATPLGPRADTVVRIRLFLQIWDSTDGTVAWEGVNELSQPAGNGAATTFSAIVERVSAELIARMP